MPLMRGMRTSVTTSAKDSAAISSSACCAENAHRATCPARSRRNAHDSARSCSSSTTSTRAPATSLTSARTPALLAGTIDAQTVALDLEADAPGGHFLPALELVVAELEDLAARLADHVVVVFVAEHVLETTAAIAGVETFDEAGLLEHRERAVDGRARHLGILLLAADQHLLRGEVVVRRQRQTHDQRTLVGPPEAVAAQVGLDDCLFLLEFHGKNISPAGARLTRAGRCPCDSACPRTRSAAAPRR